MAQPPVTAKAVWPLFQDSPLFVRWPEAQASLTELLEPASVKPSRAVFEPGDAPTHLYLVAEGSVQQTVSREGRPWLQMDIRPGQFFGQQALFTHQYQSRTVASEGAVLYRMNAANVRRAMERNPDLFDEMLHEKRAIRLRRIPLFRDLTDTEIRWLAQVIEERELEEGVSLPVNDLPGAWIVDWGQVKLRGPVNLNPNIWSDWALTAGEVFLAPNPTRSFDSSRLADRVKAAHKTHLFYLPTRHLGLLADTIRDVQTVLSRPADVSLLLGRVPLFRGLETRQLQHLAQFCAAEFVPAGQTITTQGSIGHSFVLLREGGAVVTALDDRGNPRPRNSLRAGDAYGTTSLLQGKPRDASVRAIKPPESTGAVGLNGADLIILDRRDLQYAFADYRRLWENSPLAGQFVVTETIKKRYDWMGEGEELIWHGRAHPLWLIMPETLVVLVAVLLALLIRVLPDGIRSGAGVGILTAGSLGLGIAAFLIAYNYLEDYYAITNRRVTRRDKQLLIYDARLEAPVDMVQDVTFNAGFWGRVFDYGDVSVRTAAKTAKIVFAHVSKPEFVQSQAKSSQAEAGASAKGQRREVLRRGLIADLRLALPVPERKRALGEGVAPRGRVRRWRSRTAAPSEELLPGMASPRPAWLKRLIGRLPPRWQKAFSGPAKPEPKPLSGQVLWRKHWISLLKHVGLPLLVMALLALAAVGLGPRLGRLGVSSGGLSVLWLFLILLTVGWLGWEYLDYRNDIYVVTDDRIIDIEMKPLGLYAKRREGPLDRVQNVVYQQEGIWANILNFGNVVISSAAEDEGYTFTMVANPRLVQAVIFQKLDLYRQSQEENKGQERRREIIEGLEVYHELQDDKSVSNV